MMAKSRNTIEREEAQYACFGSKYELYNVLLRASWPEIPDRDYETWTEYMRHVFEGAVAASRSLPNVQQILWDFAETQVYKKLDFKICWDSWGLER